MPICVAPLEVSEAERSTLESWVRSSTVKSGLARRARISCQLQALRHVGPSALPRLVSSP